MARTIYAVEGVGQSNKAKKLKTLLKSSGFFELLERKAKDVLIVIKCNFTPTSQKVYHYYTDPDLVNTLTACIKRRGYKNVYIVESETHFSDAFPNSSPENTAKVLGYEGRVMDLTKDDAEEFTFPDGKIELSKMMIKAAKSGLLINFAKAKNHEVFLMTCCLKNMYGSIPAKNKFTLFHQKKAGFDVPQATHYVNTITKPHFNIVDFIEGVDGDERALYYKPLKSGKRGVGIDPSLNKSYYPSRMILAGTNGLAIDKLVSLKMGYDQNESPITKRHAELIGDFDITKARVVGTTFDALPGWKRVSWHWLIHGMVEHQLPVNEDTIARGIRMYHFDKNLTGNNRAPAKSRKAATMKVDQIEIPMDYWLQWATPGLPVKPFVTKINMGETYASGRRGHGNKMIKLPKGVKVADATYLREVTTADFDDSEVEIKVVPFKVKTPPSLRHFGVTSDMITMDVVEWYFTDDWETETINLYQYDSRGDEIIIPVKKTSGYFKINKTKNHARQLSVRIDAISNQFILTEVEGGGSKHKSEIDLCKIPSRLAYTTSSTGRGRPSPKTAWLAGRKVKFFYYHDGYLSSVQEVFD